MDGDPLKKKCKSINTSVVSKVSTSPAVASIGAGRGQPHVGLAVGRGQGVAEQLRGVESASGGVGGAASGDGGGPGV